MQASEHADFVQDQATERLAVGGPRLPPAFQTADLGEDLPGCSAVG